MIEKMIYVNIMGNIDSFERVVEQYISKYDIQLESTIKELGETHGVFPFDITNSYTQPLRKLEKLVSRMEMGIETEDVIDMSKERALEVADLTFSHIESKDQEIQARETRIEQYREFIKNFEPFNALQCSVEDLRNIKYIKYRFGKMPLGSYKQFQTLLYANRNMLFVESKKVDDYMCGICFITENFINEADSLLSSFHFERVHIPYRFDGEILSNTMENVYTGAIITLERLQDELRIAHEQRISGLNISRQELFSAYQKIKELQFYLETRRFAARTSKDFFIFVGWMSEKDALALGEELEKDNEVVFVTSDGSDAKTSRAPTKLKNPWFVKPFEFLVNMYGLPSYNEVDPTFFIALTYTIVFGMMFGDVGQGAVLSIGGYVLYKLKGMKLGSIVTVIGLSSVFFGFMYGSVFGLEDLIHGIWMRPSENINKILIVAVALGVLFIVAAMFLNMINAIRQKNFGKLLFSPNGMAGVVFYVAVICVALMTVFHYTAYVTAATAVAIAALCFIAFREPLSKKLEGKKRLFGGGFFQFLFEMIIEMFEICLSYFTNTVSFVRVGAFALSHAGIMGVVLMLSETANESINPMILIIGNVFVIGFEGLVVGIQAIRLDFYEMFSRFYDGGGRQFVPYKTYKQ